METRLNGKSPLYFVITSINNLVIILNINFKKAIIAKQFLYKYTFLCSKSSHSSSDEFSEDNDDYCQEDKTLVEDNSVSNRIYPRKQPGIYMIRCTVNDKRYYGESKNVSGRLSSHKSLLHRKIHSNQSLQRDWDLYQQDYFEFVVLYMGSEWDNRENRQAKEASLIIDDRLICYNYLVGSKRPKEQNPFWGKTHTEETKAIIGESNRKPNDELGKAIILDGQIYPSISEASRQTNKARKTIRKRLLDPNDTGCIEIQQND